MSDSALVRKLRIVADLDREDEAELDALCADVETVQAKHDIVSEGDRPESVHLITEGWAARYKVLPDGARQIVAFLIPGDFCDLHMTILGQMDHSIVALNRCRVASIRSMSLDRLTSENARIARALWWSTLVDEAVLRSWVVNAGRRDAYQRIAHLLCELHARMKMIGLLKDGRFDLPLTQEDLADATALTAVHTNRTLQRLRGDDLIGLAGGVLTVKNVDTLQRAAGFDPNYLHLVRRHS